MVKKTSKSEKLILDEIVDAAHKLKISSRGLSLGEIITMIRNQLGMSQKVLARMAKVPQSTISRIEVQRENQIYRQLKKYLRHYLVKLSLSHY